MDTRPVKCYKPIPCLYADADGNVFSTKYSQLSEPAFVYRDLVLRLLASSVNNDKHKYRYIQVRCDAWKKRVLHAHVVWVAWKGPIPADHKLIYKDGDNSNCALKNLKCLSNERFYKRMAKK